MTDTDEHRRIAELERELRQLRQQNRELQAARAPRRPINWRQWTHGLLLILGLMALIPASLLVWLNRTVTTTDGYLKAVGPAIQEPAVQAAMQKAASSAILERVDVNQLVSQALPENAQFLAAPIATQVENYTYSTIGTIIASPQFATAWVEVNRRAQQRFMEIATTSSGDPIVNVNDLYKFISAQLADTRLAVLANRELPPAVGNIQVANVPALERIPHFVALLHNWGWAMLLLTATLLAAAVIAANDRRRALVRVGLGLIVATIVTLALVRIARNLALSPITDPTYYAGAATLWRTVLDPYLIQVLVLMLIGVATATLGWLLGTGRIATSLRTGTQRSLANGRDKIWPGAANSTVLRFVHRNHTWLLWGLLVLTILFLALNTPLTLATTSTILLIAVLLLVLLEFLAAPDTAPKPH